MEKIAPRRIEPEVDLDNERFWQSCRAERMELQRCRTCGRWRYFPSPVCPGCSSFEADWKPVSGRGVVFTCSVLWRPASPAYADDVPYVYAVIELEEGPMMPSNLVGIDLEAAAIDPGPLLGLSVEVRYRELRPGVVLPAFAPAGEGPGR
ncbi:MAG: OB-fold domain-containing protein [Solirubrobacterales bacterium]